MPVQKIISSKPKAVKPSAASDRDQQVFAAAKEYIQLVWRVLPFKRLDGICHLTTEQAAAFECTVADIPAKFAGFDVGIDVHRTGLVDFDVDCAEAVLFINWLLPKTSTIGRAGKPVSHLLYEPIGEVQYESFKDLNGDEMLAVIPNDRLALPPSRHRKTGEPLSWKDDCDPAEIAELNKIAREIASLTLITKLWPGKGNHHNATLALAGTLVRAKWPVDKTLHAVTLICAYTHDPKVDERHEEVKSTYERYEKGETNITGLPTLAEELAFAKASGMAKEIEVRLRDWLDLFPEPSDVPPQLAELSKYVFSLQQLFTLPTPEIDYLVEPFLAKPSMAMLFAKRGVGKTWLSLYLALCLARGEDFFAWPVPKPRRVLVIDGEMPTSWLKQRLKALLGDAADPDNLRILPVAQMWQENKSLTINQQTDQARIEQCLAEMAAQGWVPDLIIFDNLSSLTAGMDENSNSDLDDFLRWLIKLRSQGYAVLFVHHAGKTGSQRGASRREDLLDTCIELVEREEVGMDKAEGASFEIVFSKLRGERPHPDKLCVALKKNDDDGSVTWQVEEGHEIPMYMTVLKAIQDYQPATQVALAVKMQMSKQNINKHVKTARKKGLLTPVALTLTEKGKDEVKKCFAAMETMGAHM